MDFSWASIAILFAICASILASPVPTTGSTESHTTSLPLLRTLALSESQGLALNGQEHDAQTDDKVVKSKTEILGTGGPNAVSESTDNPASSKTEQTTRPNVDTASGATEQSLSTGIQGLVLQNNAFTDTTESPRLTVKRATPMYNPEDLDTAIFLANNLIQNSDETLVDIVKSSNLTEATLRTDLAYANRPHLPADIIQNAETCSKTNDLLVSVRRLLLDYTSYIDALRALRPDDVVYVWRHALEMNITRMISSADDYTPTAAPGTDTKDTQEVIYTLIALKKQGEIIVNVLQHLKNC